MVGVIDAGRCYKVTGAVVEVLKVVWLVMQETL